ncbi:IS200/IS605 family transposase [Oceanivirga salmonicida]|uniref:IS200/IS605 family transposase n=1 Tax=Oceanivirga salmonicida TaxID=1769291 RepID=UPI0008312ED2|nr:IS200/IS605 family transposase [Oceanivirga salmonicida]
MIKEHNHSSFSLHYELVLVSKNKTPIFEEEIVKFATETFKNISENYQIIFKDVHFGKDHMHFKFEAYPTSNLYKFINAFKSASSRKIKNNYEKIRIMLNGSALWEANYFLMTVGINSKDLVLHYLEEMVKCDELHHEHTKDCNF